MIAGIVDADRIYATWADTFGDHELVVGAEYQPSTRGRPDMGKSSAGRAPMKEGAQPAER
jgi:hypothetical protein